MVREPAVRLPQHDAELGPVDDSQAHGEVDLAGEPDGITADWRACSMIGRKGIQPAWLTIRPTNPTSMPVQATEVLMRILIGITPFATLWHGIIRH